MKSRLVARKVVTELLSERRLASARIPEQDRAIDLFEQSLIAEDAVVVGPRRGRICSSSEARSDVEAVDRNRSSAFEAWRGDVSGCLGFRGAQILLELNDSVHIGPLATSEEA